MVNFLKPMEKLHFLSCAVVLFGILLTADALDADRKVYIVYMGSLPKGQYFAQSHHLSILGQVLDSSSAADSLVYGYERSFNGFAAKLTHQEKQKIASMEGVVSVFESKAHQLHTTRSWDFMGFPATARRNPTVESDLIVGMIDTGVWPESESFKDDGFGPPPQRWKGICQSAGNFTCDKEPKATIARCEAIHDSSAPVVVVFSSRGPNKISRDILKPDISAPGVDILATFSPVASISQVPQDSRSAEYSILSGTSMACPHATGAAGYVKSFHLNWSPAAIKSALMTTASSMNGNMNIFAYGSGHTNPVEAADPGLVYDAEEGDYIKLLYSEGYDTTKIGLITGLKTTCPTARTATMDLNYPSMTMWVEQTGPITANFPRTVTNVGSANSTHRARFNPHPQLNVTVSPSVLKFEALGEKQKFLG